MYAIIFFSAVICTVSVIMIANPAYWRDAIVRYSQMRNFHMFEILTRLVAGGLFVVYGDHTGSPTVMIVFGYVMVATGVGLMILGPSRHTRFAIWSAAKFQNIFRPAGLASFAFGGFLIYAAVQGPALAS